MNHVGPQQRLSTRLAFLAAGLAMSAWAPLVPFAKTRLALGDAELGLLLLCLGAGSLVAMPVTGVLTARYGCRLVVLISGALTCLFVPGLAYAPTPLLLGATLFAVGASIGTLDVAMNVQAVIVERESGGSLMSGFHGLFSVGGFIGAGFDGAAVVDRPDAHRIGRRYLGAGGVVAGAGCTKFAAPAGCGGTRWPAVRGAAWRGDFHRRAVLPVLSGGRRNP